MENRIAVRRPAILQRRLAEARCRRQGWHLWQRRRRGCLSNDEDAHQWRAARRQQEQLHAHVPRRTIPTGECVLVGNHVRRQDTIADRESDQSISDQFADVAGHEDEPGRFADALHPEQITGRRQGSQLAACSKWPDLSRHAALLAEGRGTVDLAPGQWHLEAASDRRGGIAFTLRAVGTARTAPLPPDTKRAYASLLPSWQLASNRN